MTTDNELEDARGELEKLLVAVSLKDASGAQLDRLNDLLRGDAELRHFAARFLEEEAILRHQFQVLGRIGDFHSPLPKDAVDHKLLSRCRVGISGSAPRLRLRRITSYVLTASLLAVAIGAAYWVSRGQLDNGTGSSAVDLTSTAPLEHPQAQNGLLVPATVHLPRVTRVSWSGPQFESEVRAAVGTVRLHEGVVPFTSVNGRPAQGYMVHLPPGGQLDLVVSADAEGENSLAVIEFEADGSPTGRRITFSNSLADRSRKGTPTGRTGSHTRFGPIGSWSERNSSPFSKYYCFTSVHKLLDRSKDDSWQVSRLAVMFEEPELAHVGWDDSGMVHPDKPAEGQKPDLDFDDLSATIRVHRPDQVSAAGRGEFRVIADSFAHTHDTRPLDLADGNAAFPIAIGPKKTIIIKVTNRFRTPTGIALIDKSTGKICWQFRSGSRPLPSSAACAIQNDTPNVRNLALITDRTRTSDSAGKSNLPPTPSVLFEQGGFVSLVFDEGPNDPDYDDVRVDILMMDPL